MEFVNIILESERLYFRRIEWSDFDELSIMLCDDRVMYAWEHTFLDSQINEWIEKQLAFYERDGIGYLAVISKDTGELVGQMGLHWSSYDNSPIFEVCYMLKYEHFNKGYAVEGANALIRYAFSDLNIKTVYATIKHDNWSSIKVAENLGMEKTGSFIKHYNGKDMEHILFSIQNPNFVASDGNVSDIN